jgi:hypothetical protein
MALRRDKERTMKAISVVALALASLITAQSAVATTYVVNQTPVAFTQGETNAFTATCPAGYFATGGGYNIDSSPYPPNYFLENVVYNINPTGVNPVQNVSWGMNTIHVPLFILYENQPASGTGTGWTVGGYASAPVTLTVYVVCASQN